MKKKVKPASVTKTAKKVTSKKAAFKKKVTKKRRKSSKSRVNIAALEEGEIPPTEALPRTSNDYVNVIESKLINDGTQLLVILQARAGGQINFFGFRVENDNGDLLEFVQPPDWDNGEQVKLTYNIPDDDVGILETSDYSVVILTKKRLY